MPATLLTVKQVAQRLNVTPRTIGRWHRDGLLPSVKLPSGAVRFDPDVVERVARGELETEPKGAA